MHSVYNQLREYFFRILLIKSYKCGTAKCTIYILSFFINRGHFSPRKKWMEWKICFPSSLEARFNLVSRQANEPQQKFARGFWKSSSFLWSSLTPSHAYPVCSFFLISAWNTDMLAEVAAAIIQLKRSSRESQRLWHPVTAQTVMPSIRLLIPWE